MIFCDMDGVLVDFDRAFLQKFGVSPEDYPSREEMWQLINSTPDYWVDIPKTEDADELIGYLSKFDFKILTGLPHTGYEKAEIEKREWIKNHFNIDVEVITCLAKDKHTFGKKSDVLIDDFERNIKAWQKMGGVGILHKSASDTIEKLKQLGY